MNALTQPAALAASHLNINLTDFIDEFGDELLESLNRSNPCLLYTSGTLVSRCRGPRPKERPGCAARRTRRRRRTGLDTLRSGRAGWDWA